MIIAEVLKAARAADDLDTTAAVVALLNAESAIETGLGGDPAAWTADRVMRVGALFAAGLGGVRKRPELVPGPAYQPRPWNPAPPAPPAAADAPFEAAAPFGGRLPSELGSSAVEEALAQTVNGSAAHGE